VDNCFQVTFKTGATIQLSGDFGELSREEVKEALTKLDVEPAYIGYNKGDSVAYLRLSDENSAAPVSAQL